MLSKIRPLPLSIGPLIVTPTPAAPFVTDLVTRRCAATHTDLALPFAIGARLLDTILREPVTLTLASWTGDKPHGFFWFTHRRSYLTTHASIDKATFRDGYTFEAYGERTNFDNRPSLTVLAQFVVVVHHLAISSAD